MIHILTLILILGVLILYSNVLTTGCWIFLKKRELDLEADLLLFLAFSLNITTIFLLLILPKFLFSFYPLSLTFLGIGLLTNLVYSLRNRGFLKKYWPEFKEKIRDYRLLLVIWGVAILLMIIPAIHYPWYFGYGVDWVNHLEIVKEYIIGGRDIFYPAINVHAFLSILNLLHLPYPEVFQISSAFLLSLSVFPFYFISKLLLPSPKAVNISLLLWLILPYNHFLYGEFIPNGTSVFFFFTFLLVVLIILKQCLIGKRENLGFFSLLGGLFLAGAIYNHQVFLYPFFYVYFILTILYFLSFRTIKYVVLSYVKILSIAAFLLLPFLGKLYSGSQEVLAIHSGRSAPYQLQFVLSMIHNHIGLATLLAAFLGTCLYCYQYLKKKDRQSKFNTIIIASLFVGNFLAVNVYFGGNPFWSERSLYLLGVFAALPIAYLIYFWVTQWPKRIWHVLFYMLFFLVLSSRIEYSFNIDPLWSKELQASIEWAKSNSPFTTDKTIYLVFNDSSSSSVNHVFQLAFSHKTNLPVFLIGKDEYIKNTAASPSTVLLDNNYFTVTLQTNNLFFDYKVEAIKSGDGLNFREDLTGKPKLSYTLDSMLRRYFLDRKIDQYSSYFSGLGLLINANRYVGQSFIPMQSSTDRICVNLSKGELNDTNSQPPFQEKVWLELFQENNHSLLLKSDVPQEKLNAIPVNQYINHCFPVKIPFTPGTLYRFYLKSNATARSYATMNAGRTYPLGSAYIDEQAVNDDLLFSTKYRNLLSF